MAKDINPTRSEKKVFSQAIARCIKDAGGVNVWCKKIGVSKMSVSDWRRTGYMPLPRAVAVAEITNEFKTVPIVTVRQLAPWAFRSSGLDDFEFDTLFVPGRPIPQKRPRVTRGGGHTYNPKIYEDWKKKIRRYAKIHKIKEIEGPVHVETLFLFDNAQYVGDNDKLAGAVFDALEGIAYANDKQIKKSSQHKIILNKTEAEYKDLSIVLKKNTIQRTAGAGVVVRISPIEADEALSIDTNIIDHWKAHQF